MDIDWNAAQAASADRRLLLRLQRPSGAERPLLWDGGIGTALIARGLVLADAPPEAWLFERPEEVVAVHAGFAAAGADAVQTNSFGLLRLQFGGWSAARGPLPLAELAQRSVALARRGAAVGAPAAVVASLGPVGQPGLDFEVVAAAAGATAAAFAAAGVAALHLETFYDPGELRAVLHGIRAAAPELPLLVSVTVTMGQSGLETPLGTPLARMLRELEKTPPLAVGVNCSQTARRMVPAVVALREWAGAALSVLAQPQVGQPAPDCKRPAVVETPAQFAQNLAALVEAGADAVGGCCGCRSDHLQAAHAHFESSYIQAVR